MPFTLPRKSILQSSFTILSEVIVIAGDGDCAAIGGNHLIHAARRNIGITVVVFNNNIYGMTGGQMAPTTMPGEKATTCIYGRDPKVNGNPVHMCEMLATLTGPAYIERVSCYDENALTAEAAYAYCFQRAVSRQVRRQRSKGRYYNRKPLMIIFFILFLLLNIVFLYFHTPHIHYRLLWNFIRQVTTCLFLNIQ